MANGAISIYIWAPLNFTGPLQETETETETETEAEAEAEAEAETETQTVRYSLHLGIGPLPILILYNVLRLQTDIYVQQPLSPPPSSSFLPQQVEQTIPTSLPTKEYSTIRLYDYTTIRPLFPQNQHHCIICHLLFRYRDQNL
ncbi:hypothetical protein ACMFMG_005798 [Clarireedia jacksonii]